jgi:CTP synthase
VIICRSAEALTFSTREKLASFCHVKPECVWTVHDVSNIYHVPLLLEAQHATSIILRQLKTEVTIPADCLSPWRELALSVDSFTEDVRIALVGKYTGLQDSYLSVIKSLQHAAIACKKRLVVDWIDATSLEPRSASIDKHTYDSSWETVKSAQGILVPGGFGDRGVEGKILAIQHARENKVPFLGICLGMQCAVIEYARNVLGYGHANSTEFDTKTPYPVVIFMPEINPSQLGGTMRLGSRSTMLRARPDGKPSLAAGLYGYETKSIWERHRHRYEVNPAYVNAIQEAGLFFVGTDDRSQRMEIVELDSEKHPFFFASQYHPEFLSHPHKPSLPFYGFILAAIGQLREHLPLTTSVSGRRTVSRSSSLHSTPVSSFHFSSTNTGSGTGGGSESPSRSAVMKDTITKTSGAVVGAIDSAIPSTQSLRKVNIADVASALGSS